MAGRYAALSDAHDIDIEYYLELARAERNKYLKELAIALVAKFKGMFRSGLQMTASKPSPSH